MINKLLNEEHLTLQIDCLYFNDYSQKFYNAILAIDDFKVYVFETNSQDKIINQNLSYSLPRFASSFLDITLVIDEKLYGLRKYKNCHRVTICDRINDQSILIFYKPHQKGAFKMFYNYLKLQKVKINFTRTNAKNYI